MRRNHIKHWFKPVIVLNPIHRVILGDRLFRILLQVSQQIIEVLTGRHLFPRKITLVLGNAPAISRTRTSPIRNHVSLPSNLYSSVNDYYGLVWGRLQHFRRISDSFRYNLPLTRLPVFLPKTNLNTNSW